MSTNILETLPWIDYREVFDKIEERGRETGIAEGKAEGKAEGIAQGKVEGKVESQMDVAMKAFARLGRGKDPDVVSQMLKVLDIPAHIIKAAQAEVARTLKTKIQYDPER